MAPFLNKIGTCPVCHKGEMVENNVGFTCNLFKGDTVDTENKCNFVIYHQYHGKFITEAIAKQLIENGITEPIEFTNRNGEPFMAKLAIVDGKVETVFDYEYLTHTCPKCGGRIRVTRRGYTCENAFREQERCDFTIRKVICNREISVQEAEDFLDGKRNVLDGFVTKAGKTFSSILSYTESSGVHLNSRIGKCPKCGGDIHVGIKAYNCSNFVNPQKQCDFRIWRQHWGHNVTPTEAQQILEKGQTDEVIAFSMFNGNQTTGRLTYNENFKIIIK